MPDFKIYEEISLCDPFIARQKEQIYFMNLRLLGNTIGPIKVVCSGNRGCSSTLGTNQGLINKWRKETDLAPVI